MRVNQSGNNSVYGSDLSSTKKANGAAKTQGAQQAKSAEKAAQTSTIPGSVNSTISSKAKDMAQAKEVASKAPDVREDKIAELKARIAAGKYNVDAAAVADRMVDDHLKMNIG